MGYAWRVMVTVGQVCLASALLLITAAAARGDFYQYTDESGTMVIVDDASKVPARFRRQTQRRDVEVSRGGRSTGVTIRNNRVLVPVTLTYHGRMVAVTLLLDTGASTTMITTDAADRLGISPEATEVRHAQVADGRVLDTYLAVVDTVTVGPKVSHAMEVSIMSTGGRSIGADGLLGMNFLGAHPYHLDMNSRTINWMD